MLSRLSHELIEGHIRDVLCIYAAVFNQRQKEQLARVALSYEALT